MLIAERVRAIREHKKLSQGDIENRTGLLRCYISRVENGHTVPAIETLERIAQALEMPLYQLLYDGEELPNAPLAPVQMPNGKKEWGSSGKNARFMIKLRAYLARLAEHERQTILTLAKNLASPNRQRSLPGSKK
jgi:transcriptional regulator with XRE-family HTH domain